MARQDVKLSGPLFQPENAEKFKAHLAAAMESKARALETKIKAKAAVETGVLRDSVKVTVAAAKPNKKTGKGGGKWIAIRAEATATRKRTEGDGTRRYGRVPYGVFRDHKDGFLTATVEAERAGLVADMGAAAKSFVASLNATPMPPVSPAK